MRDIDGGVKARLQKNELTRAGDSQVDFKVYIGRSKDFIQTSSDYYVELIRKKEGVSDIEVVPRRMKATRNPDKLFDIHIDGGKVITATRNFVKKENEEWQDQFQLGFGITCSICFDGHWISRRGKWMLLTEEFPWVFYADLGKRLWAQVWDKTTKRFELATDVMKVKSIRAWKSVYFPELDLGIVVFYQKTDGKLYYRNYCMQQDGRLVWEAEREFLYDGSVRSFNLFETNDFRVGVAVTDGSGRTTLAFSKRNWAGMGVRGEFLDLQIRKLIRYAGLDVRSGAERENIRIKCIRETVNGYCRTDNLLLKVYNISDDSGDYGKRVVFGTWHELYEWSGADFKVTDSRGVSAYASTVSSMGRGSPEDRYPFLYVAEYENLNNFRGTCVAEILGQTTKNAVGLLYEPMNLEFVPVGLVPNEVPAPTLIDVRNQDDKHILLVFDREIFSGLDSVLTAVEIKSRARRHTATTEEVEDVHELIHATLSEDKKELLLSLNPRTRLRRALSVTVKYANGTLTGESEPVANFERTFIPVGLDGSNDVGENEYIDLTIAKEVKYETVEYLGAYTRENVKIETARTVEYVDVGTVNP